MKKRLVNQNHKKNRKQLKEAGGHTFFKDVVRSKTNESNSRTRTNLAEGFFGKQLEAELLHFWG